MKKLRRVMSLLLACAMVLSGLTVLPAQPVQAEETAQEYTIYPTPQSVVYGVGGGTLTLPGEINAVFEEGIDQATKDRLGAVMSVKDITVKEVNAAEGGKTNILVGIAGSDGAAAAYAQEHLEYDESLFSKVDAYLLAIEANQITIVGKDTDAAFYAMASLKMILEQSEGMAVRQLQMEDYAVGQYRGFIEGYYGIPWSVDDRISLMEFGGDFKMNTYIFAPKDDPYHNSMWRELYPEEELANIRRMVAAGTASKCRFLWAIHPFMNQGINLSNYDESLEVVKAKFQQLYDAGVRQFVISADDASSNTEVQVKLLNDMSAWSKSKGDCYNLVFVPMIYCTAAANWGYGISLTNYYNKLKEVDEDVEFMWTGEWVCHPATQYTFDHFKQISGKEPFMWLNWPVNDVNHARLVMGPAENCVLNTGGVTGFKGIVTNPLEQAEASKVSLFAIADYAWNTAAFDCEKSWADSFQYIDGGAPDSLHELCKHMTNPDPGGIKDMAESKELEPYIEAFQEDPSVENGNALVAEFEKIAAAADDFQKNGVNANLIDEMNPWVDSLREISKAGAAYVKTQLALDAGDESTAVKEYIKAVNAYEISKNCPAPQLGGTTIKAQAGAMVIMPFVLAMDNAVKADMEKVLKHSFGGSDAGGGTVAEATVIHSGLGGIYENYVLANMTDGNLSTYTWFNQAQTAGAYIGLDLGDQYQINNVSIYQGNSDTHGDIFANAIMEYSSDGVNYTEIETITNTNNIIRDYTDDSIIGRYIRIRTDRASNSWYAIREFTVTTSAPSYDVYTNADSAKELRMSVKKNEASILAGEEGTDLTLKAGEYVGIEVPRIREITSISADYTANANLILEGSLNGMDWEEVQAGEQNTDLSIIRIRNKGTSDVSFKLNALAFTNSDRDARFVSTVEWEEGYDPVYAADNSLLTSFKAKEGSGAGSFNWRITKPVQVGSVCILAYPGTAEGAKVSLKTNDNQWVEAGSLADGLNSYSDLEWYDCIKEIKVDWESKAPRIVEIYTTAPRTPGITLDRTSVSMKLDATVTLKAEVFVAQGEDRTVSWTSSAPEIASVDENGVVTAKQVGNAVITASAANGKYTAECAVAVSRSGEPVKLTIVEATAGSEQPQAGSEGPASLAIDGNNNTFWHSLWDGDEMENLWITADLGAVYDVTSYTYYPRPANSTGTRNGFIEEYAIYVSEDNENWTLAAVGEFENDGTLQTVNFLAAVPARYVRLNALAVVSDSGPNFASAAEIGVFGTEHDDAIVDKRQALDALFSADANADKYTEDSYETYILAVQEVMTVIEDVAATQEDVDSAVRAYRDAASKLVIKVTSITVNPDEVLLKVGTTANLTVTVQPSDATDKSVTFTSDKPEVASVNAEGVVEAKSRGTAVITVAGANGVTATCTVNAVDTIEVTGLKLIGAPKRPIDIGATVTVEAVVEPNNADNQQVTWVSSNPAVATVENGVVTAVAGGETEITVTTEDGGFTQKFTVKVNYPPVVNVTGLELSGVPVNALNIGDKVTVTAKVLPEDADNKNVTWASSNPAVATVENGVVTAVAAGDAEISAKTEDGGFTQKFAVKVNPKQDVNGGNNDQNPQPPAPAPAVPAKGKVYTVSGSNYKVASASVDGGTVAFTGYKGNTKTSIKIPASVTIEGKPYKVTSIAKKALHKKTKLATVTIGNNVTSIDASAFEKCTSLKKVTIGTALKTIGKKAFSGDKKLSSITIKSKKLTKVNSKALSNVKNVTITVPKAKKKAYTRLFKGKGAKKVKMKAK